MSSIADGSVRIQTSSASNLSTPSWFGEVLVMTAHLRKHDVLSKVTERVRFARKRFGRYDVIDFLAVLFGYAISGERTLEDFYERLQPFAVPFMALFDRDRLPSRSALSRFLAALTEEPVEALRTLFLDDLLSCPLTPDKQEGGLVDRAGNTWMVFDIDGTREAARQRALPQTDELPPPFRRLDDVCAPGRARAANAGKSSGHEQRCRRRTVISGSAVSATVGTSAIGKNCARGSPLLVGIWQSTPCRKNAPCCALPRQYGNGAVLADVAGFAFVARGKDYHLLDHPLLQARLHLPPDQLQQRPESQMVRCLYDCPQIPVGPDGKLYRVVPRDAQRDAHWAGVAPQTTFTL